MKRETGIKSIIIIGMFTAVLAVLSIIQIPMPTGVPITLQTFAVALCGYVLGHKKGAAAAGLYLLVGAIGVPVFAGMSAGLGIVLGPTGGFLFGFIVMAFLCGLCTAKKRGYSMVLGLAGLAVCHLIGALQFSLVTGNSFTQSLVLVSLPYLVKDILSVAGAMLAGEVLRKQLLKADLVVYGQPS